ncbi:amidohydrolase family protein [Sabulicella glaciei]|uniref:Amidohydrolase family protein n=1 Tax=Sabulicella glaciei TaxID=2984948 RepID=A0ABT3NSB5_9PROT|nr:amidohydrolase family protein [Roseococcus sp. MDT2-1-1]MCW8084444.1 amidohydrolase family protein [Roseococcus sp. MDT2-1-1]
MRFSLEDGGTMDFTCAPAKPRTNPPRTRAPEGSCDSHFHIFGPYDRFPLDPGRPYTPPPALVPHYLDMAGTLGLSRRVVVQASVYGTDNRVTMDAVQALGPADTRAVVVVDEAADLPALAAGGAVGVRFNAVSGNGAPLEQLEALAHRVAPLGWHIQIYTTSIEEVAPRLSGLPVPVVLDHMGGVNAAQGPDSPAMRALLRLLEGDGAWVKLSGYRASKPPYGDLAPIARALAKVAPTRCVWGTDWPHTQFRTEAEMLDDGALLDWLYDWVPEPRAILVDNPARLYGF